MPAIDRRVSPDRLVPILLFVLAYLFLWKTAFGQQALLPARLAAGMAPWQAALADGSQAPAPWNPLLWDGIAQFYPWRNFAARTLGEGVIPLWNPYQFCGTPFVANSQSAVFYPLNLIFLLWPTALAFAVSARLHLWLAGLFMFCLLRHWNRSAPAAFLGGLAYMFCGFSVAWLELPTFLNVASWLPLLILLADRCFTRQKWSTAAAAGAVLGLILLAGHLQIAFYCILALFLWWLFHLAASFRQKADLVRLTGQLALILAIGFLMAGPQLLPAIELSSMSHRSGTPTAAGYAAYIAYAMPFSSLITFLVPDFFGNPAQGTFWGPANYAEYCGYIGILPLLLGGLGLLASFRRERPCAYLGVLAVIALALALGTPLAALLYFYVPGFGQSGSPARSLILYQFALIALSAFGMDALLDVIRPLANKNHGPHPSARKVSRKIASLLILGAAAVLLLPVLVADRYGDRMNLDAATLMMVQYKPILTALALLTAAWLLASLALRRRLSLTVFQYTAVLMAAADLFAFGMNYNLTAPPEAVYPKTGGLEYLQHRTRDGERIFPVNLRWSLYETPPATLPPNAAMVYRLFEVAGYDSLYSGRWKRFLNALEGKEASPLENGNMTFTSRYDSPLADLLGVRYVMSREAIEAEGFRRVYDNEIKIYENLRAMPRVFLAGSVESLPLSETLDRLARPDFPIGSKTLLDAGATGPAPPGGSRGPARLTAYSPTRISAEAHLESAGLLVLSDAYYPGWKAFADDKPAPLLRADYILRAVPLPPGSHRVEFRYEPTAFRLGLYMGMCALAILAGAMVCKGIGGPGR
ncbi:MAG: YfhO family protein [Armatimonadetes bacterium]|nr:YfhO family protein [Armatimonadota bacterium]